MDALLIVLQSGICDFETSKKLKVALGSHIKLNSEWIMEEQEKKYWKSRFAYSLNKIKLFELQYCEYCKLELTADDCEYHFDERFYYLEQSKNYKEHHRNKLRLVLDDFTVAWWNRAYFHKGSKKRFISLNLYKKLIVSKESVKVNRNSYHDYAIMLIDEDGIIKYSRVGDPDFIYDAFN